MNEEQLENIMGDENHFYDKRVKVLVIDTNSGVLEYNRNELENFRCDNGIFMFSKCPDNPTQYLEEVYVNIEDINCIRLFYEG